MDERSTYEGVWSDAEKSLARGLICRLPVLLDPEREVGRRAGVLGAGEPALLLFCFLDGGRGELQRSPLAKSVREIQGHLRFLVREYRGVLEKPFLDSNPSSKGRSIQMKRKTHIPLADLVTLAPLL